MTLLRSRIYDKQRQKRDAERAADRRAQVGSGDRSERIRTYNFLQGRLTDHVTQHQAGLLAAPEGGAA